ncbi:MAG: hypothetical protein ABSC51_11270 [Gaiellaceae bacterium]|jgi:hypothetical protein
MKPQGADPDAVAASLGRARFARWAVVSTIVAIAMFAALPFGIVSGQYRWILGGSIFLVLAPFATYLAFCFWWYAICGRRFIPPRWVGRFGRWLDATLNKNVRL